MEHVKTMSDASSVEREMWKDGHLLPYAVEALGYTALEYIKEFAPDPIRVFVRTYAGNACEAARNAGYADKSSSYKIMQMPLVRAAIELRGQTEMEALFVAKKEYLQAFWTATMLDEGESLPSRLAASDKLARSFAMFIDKIESKHDHSFSIDDALLNLAERGRKNG